MSLRVSALLNPSPSPEPTAVICGQLHLLPNADHAVAFGTQSQESGHRSLPCAHEPPQVSLPSATLSEDFNQASDHRNELVSGNELTEELQRAPTLILQLKEVSLTCTSSRLGSGGLWTDLLSLQFPALPRLPSK